MEVVGKFWRISPTSIFPQIRPVTVEFHDMERENDRRNEGENGFLQLIFKQFLCMEPNFIKA